MPAFLVDAQQMSREHPDTFEVPSPGHLNALRPGDFVKVCRHEERFWLVLREVTETSLLGTVANDLLEAGNADLPYGELLRCERRHVFAVLTAEQAGPEHSWNH